MGDVKTTVFLKMHDLTKKKATDQNTPVVCICGYKDIPRDFTWASLDGKMVLLCWGCTDKLHKNTMAKENE